MSKEKNCKKCEHYVNGMCFKKTDNVKIVKESDTCVWDSAEQKGKG